MAEAKLPFWRRPAFVRCFLAPAASAFLLLAAFSPLNLRPLVFVGLVPWLLAMPYATRKEAWRSGMAFNFVFALGQMYFVVPLAAKVSGSLGLGFLPWLACLPLGLMYFGPIALVMNWCCRTQRLWLIPLVWAVVEIWRSYMFVIAFPVGLIAEPLATYPALINSALWLTIYGVGAWVVVGNLIVAGLIRKRRPVLAIGVFAAVLASSLFLYMQPITGTAVRIVDGQPGVDIAFTKPALANGLAGAAMDRTLDIAEAEHADLTVMPEGMLDFPTGEPVNLPFRPRTDAPIVFGAQRGKHPPHQSAFSYDGHWEHADKTRLVIFGEFVPYRDVFPFLKNFDLPMGDLAPGDKVSALHVGKLTVGPIICFEEMFPDVTYRQKANGAQLLAIISEDDWFRDTPELGQLRDSCVFRAIETGVPVVRAASTGYSIVIDQRGRVIASAPVGPFAALPATVYVRE
jgi:apolipoprotein N-acyltransferase